VTRPHAAKPCRGFAFQPVYAHISDLHITDHDRTRDGREPGNSRLPAILDAINRKKPRVLVISGDITDEGTAAQWRLVEQFMGRLDPGIAVFIATGNHDVNHFFEKDPAERPVRWPGAAEASGLDVEPRIFRAVEFQARHLTAVNTAGINLTDYVKRAPDESNVSTFPQQIAECVMSCIPDTDGTPSEVKLQMASCRGLCAHDLRSIRFHYFQDIVESFPTYYIDRPTSTAFIGLTTSLGDSAEVGRNAIGITGRKQINNLRAVLSKLPRTVKHIVLVQHHPPLWTGLGRLPRLTSSDSQDPVWDRFYSSPWFLSVFLHNDVKESEEIFEILTAELSRRRGVDAIVAFGHRHERSLSEIGPVILEEAPNLATKDPNDFGFYLVSATGTSLDVSWCGVRQ
jgi:3',5'-cyclic AMP phosphodiesterase CpdA